MAAVTTFATTAAVQTRLGLGSSVDTTLIGQVLDGVTAAMARYCGRLHNGTNLMLRQSSFTEYLTGDGGRVLKLSLWPIESVTSVTYDPTRVFTGVTAFTANTDYVLDDSAGLLYRVWRDWEDDPLSIKVVYVGGYVDPGSTPSTGQIALPNDIIEACLQQTCFVYQSRMRYGVKSESHGDGSYTTYADDLLPSVRAILDAHRRLM